VSTFLILGMTAVAMWAFGRWALRHPEELLPTWMPPDEIARRVRVLRRGARSMCVVSLIVGLAAVLALF
jgi:hypothetical protein